MPLHALAFVGAVGVIAWIFSLVGVGPLDGFRIVFTRPLVSASRLRDVALHVIPLGLIAAGLAFAFRSSVWNLGAEGQFLIGAAASGSVAIYGPGPSLFLIVMSLMFGALAGAAWGWLAGALRNRYGLEEVLASLLLNPIATLFVGYVVRVPLRDPSSSLLWSRQVPARTALPTLPLFETHAGILITIIGAVALQFLARRTAFGYSARLSGLDPVAAAHAGIERGRVIARVMVLSGGSAGLAGAVQTLSVQSRIHESIAGGIGFEGVIAAALGGMWPIGGLAMSVILSSLRVGGDVLQREAQSAAAVIDVIQAVMLLLMLLAGVLHVSRRNAGST